MRTLVSNGLVLFAGLLSVPAGSSSSADLILVTYQDDPRLIRLQRVLAQMRSPLLDHAEDFLAAADKHELDWRLLPSISIIESSAGKAYRNNNVFGWANCNVRFPSVRHGIHSVAYELANSKYYKDKDLDGKLHTYNARREYRLKVKQVMRSIGPEILN